MQKWLITLLCSAASGLIGWFGGVHHGMKKACNALSDEFKPSVKAPSEPEKENFIHMDYGDIDRVIEEHFAQSECPPEDLPDDISVPDLPFEQEGEEEEEDTDGFQPFYDAPHFETISEDEYLSEYHAYGKETLLYFHEIDELTFADEDRVDDKMGTVGSLYDIFFDERGMRLTDVAYVRNNRMGIDFMVELKDGSPYWYESE